MEQRFWQFASFVFVGVCIVFGQNCSQQNVQFELAAQERARDSMSFGDAAEYPGGSGSPESAGAQSDSGFQKEAICDPLTGATVCDQELRNGLRGAIYSLTQELFPYPMNDATIDDYLQYGISLPYDIIMSTINVPSQDWTLGFQVSTGDYLRDNNGELLNEYFALDLHGYVHFPEASTDKEIELAAISDDGIRVIINGEDVLIDDFLHAPRWACGSKTVHFAPGEKKQIHLQYYQGPRTRIALQLFYREVGSGTDSCNEWGGWKLFEPQQLFH